MRLLTINTGSSSLKAALYQLEEPERADFSATIARIGLRGGQVNIRDATGHPIFQRKAALPDHAAALHAFLHWMEDQGYSRDLGAVGHRIVHGGRDYSEPQVVDEQLISALRGLVPIDPMHLPQAINAIEMVAKTFPGMTQIACFDTAFHRHMPRVAQVYALPARFEEEGLIRYGFHGLSYEYITQQLRSVDPDAMASRVIIAHLGNGASMAAVLDGRGMDTTMGFTPLGGLVMGTRPGDLDPGVLLYLLQGKGMSPDHVARLMSSESGLLGVSGTSEDMHDLLQREETDRQAALAVELFCYQARKFLGAMAAALGGLDTLVFTGGIGEHAAPVRERICAGLAFLGVDVNPERNAADAAIISPEGSGVTVRIMQTDEDLMIARHTSRLIRERGGSRVSI